MVLVVLPSHIPILFLYRVSISCQSTMSIPPFNILLYHRVYHNIAYFMIPFFLSSLLSPLFATYLLCTFRLFVLLSSSHFLASAVTWFVYLTLCLRYLVLLVSSCVRPDAVWCSVVWCCVVLGYYFEIYGVNSMVSSIAGGMVNGIVNKRRTHCGWDKRKEKERKIRLEWMGIELFYTDLASFKWMKWQL